MYNVDIIHGDMKPKNVLIFEEETGSYTAKVADFGFSTYFHEEQEDLIQMPKSVPWTAPEHHVRYFTSQSAKVMDVYSFGMLCLWLLFNNKSSEAKQFSFEAGYWQDKDDILLFWKNNKLLKWTMQLVTDDASIGTEIKLNLTSFFRSCLDPDTQKRNADWDYLLRRLAPTQ
jgi:serine/threonine protein kinase